MLQNLICKKVRENHTLVRLCTFLLFFGIFTTSIFAQINTDKFKVTIVSNDMGPCGGSNNEITAVTLKAKLNTSNTFKIAFNLPDGVTYVASTLSLLEQNGSQDFSVTEFNITDLNAPIFSIERSGNGNWEVNDQIKFSFEKTASCEAVQFSYNGGIFKDAHSISFIDNGTNYSNTDNDLTVNSYDLLKAYLSITGSYNSIFALVGETETRSFSITNSGNGTISSFTHIVTIGSNLDANYSLSFNGTTLTPSNISGNLQTYTIDLSQAPFAGNVGDGDTLFENESILLTEEFKVENCTDDVIIHQSKWGCSTSVHCQETSSASGFVNISTEDPSLEITAVSAPLPDFATTVSYVHTLENTAVDANDIAYNVHINIGFNESGSEETTPGVNPMWGDDFYGSRTLNNFRLNGNPVTTQKWTYNYTAVNKGLGSDYIPADFLTSDPDGPGGLEDLDSDGFFDDLAPGNSVNISFDLAISDRQPPECDASGRWALPYERLNIDVFSVNQCGRASDTEREFINRSEVKGLYATNDQPIDVVDGTPFIVNISSYFLVHDNDDMLCNGAPLLSDDLSTSYTVTLTVPDGILLSGSPTNFSQSGNIITHTTTGLGTNDYYSSIVDFPLAIDCNVYTGPKNLLLNYKVTYSNSCFDTDLFCGTSSFITHCDDLSGCVAPITTSFSAERETAGWTDNTMATKVTLDPNAHRLDVYMAKDEMVVNTSATMNLLSSDNLFLRITYDTNLLDQADETIIQYLNGSIIINDLSSGSQSTTLNIAPVITTDGNTKHVITFDLSSYRSIISGSYKYGEGLEEDEIDIELHFVVNKDFKSAVLYNLTNFRGEFYSLDGGGSKLACDSYGAKASYIKPLIEMSLATETEITACGITYLYASLSQVSGIDPIFTNEYRPTAFLEETKIEIPAGSTFLNAVYSYDYDNVQPENEAPSSTNGGLNYSVTGNTVTIAPGPKFRQLDFGYPKYPSVQIAIEANNSTLTTADYDVTIKHKNYPYSNAPEDNSETRTGAVLYKQPNINISSSTPVQTGDSQYENFEVTVCSYSPEKDINFNWLKVNTPGFSITEAVEVTGSGDISLNFTQNGANTFIEIGAFLSNNDSCKTIRFKGSYTNCTNQDITIENSWNCNAYPADFNSANYTNPIVVKLEPVPAAIQLSLLNQPSTTVDMCTDFNISLEYRNAGQGDLISPSFTFDVPGNITGLSIEQIAVEYPKGSGNIENISHSISGNTVTVDLMGHSGINGMNGLVGSNNAANIEEQIALISLTLNPKCEYISNTGSTYTAFGNSPCGATAIGNGSKITTNPIIITGAEPPYLTSNTVVSNSGTLEGCSTETVSIKTLIVDGTTGLVDYVKITLPENINYVNGSFICSSALQATFSSVTTVGVNQVVEITLPNAAPTGSLIEYSIGIESTPEICPGDYDINLNTYVTTNNLFCNGVSCGTTQIVTGADSYSISVTKGDLKKSSFAAEASYIKNVGDNNYAITIGIENVGTVDLASGLVYSVYCADNSGVKTGPALYSGATTQAITASNSIQENISFNTTSFCGDNGNIVVEFVPAATNCFCEILSIPITSSENNDYADLKIEKTTATTSVNVGSDVTYQIIISNNGPLTATGVSLEDIMPVGLQINTATIDNGGTYDAAIRTIFWNIPTINANASLTVSYTVTINIPSGTLNEYKNIAQITASDQVDSDSSPNNDNGDQSEDDEDSLTVAIISVDLELNKTISDTNPNVGEVVTFSISLSNNGPDNATNVAVEDIIPAGYSNITLISNGGTLSGNTISWTALAVPTSGIILTYNATINAPTGTVDEYKNVAQVTDSDQFDPDSTPNNDDGDQSEDDEDSLTLGSIISADLELNKSISNTNPNVGEVVTFSIALINKGPDNATNVEVEDIIPAGYSNITLITNGGTLSGNTISWTALAVPTTGIILTYNATINEPTGTVDEYKNVAQVTDSDQFDPDSTPNNDDGDQSEDDEDSLTLGSIISADLELNKSISNTNPNVGEVVTFSIALINKGPDNATNVEVEDIIPAGYSNITLITNGGTLSGNTISWTALTVPTTGITLTYNATINEPTGAVDEYKNVAQVTDSDQFDPDSTPGNDDGDQSEDDEDSLSINTNNDADLAISKSMISGANPSPGDIISFEVILQNNGPNNATNISIEDMLPTGLTLNTNSLDNGATFSLNTNTITWNIASLSANSTITLSYTVLINSPTNSSTEYTNIAQVTATDQPDPNSTPDNYDPSRPLENDEAIFTVSVTTIVDIAIRKTVDIAEVEIGDTVVFTITAENVGTSILTGIKIDDTLPNGFNFVLETTTIGDYNENIGEWAIDRLNPNEIATLEITVTIIVGTDYTNIAQLNSMNEIDENSANDRDEASVTILESKENCFTIYNEFSPNNDSANEVFYIDCVDQYPNNTLQIFNRWGHEIFEMKGYNNTWRGTSQGTGTIKKEEKLPVGTYYYIFDFGDEKTEPKSGWLYLTR